MSYSFNHSLTTYLDWVRLLTNDTDPDCVLLEDETINALIQTLGYLPAVAQVCETLIIKYANEPDFYQQHYSQEFQWRERVSAWKDLRNQARTGILLDPFDPKVAAQVAVIRETHIGKERPTIPVPSVTPSGKFGGYRSN